MQEVPKEYCCDLRSQINRHPNDEAAIAFKFILNKVEQDAEKNLKIRILSLYHCDSASFKTVIHELERLVEARENQYLLRQVNTIEVICNNEEGSFLIRGGSH